jgi:hypothetical protein
MQDAAGSSTSASLNVSSSFIVSTLPTCGNQRASQLPARRPSVWKYVLLLIGGLAHQRNRFLHMAKSKYLSLRGLGFSRRENMGSGLPDYEAT